MVDLEPLQNPAGAKTGPSGAKFSKGYMNVSRPGGVFLRPVSSKLSGTPLAHVGPILALIWHVDEGKSNIISVSRNINGSWHCRLAGWAG